MTVGTEHCRGSPKNINNSQFSSFFFPEMYAKMIESEGRGAFNLKVVILILASVPYVSLSLRLTMGGVGVLGNVDDIYRS